MPPRRLGIGIGIGIDIGFYRLAASFAFGLQLRRLCRRTASESVSAVAG